MASLTGRTQVTLGRSDGSGIGAGIGIGEARELGRREARSARGIFISNTLQCDVQRGFKGGERVASLTAEEPAFPRGGGRDIAIFEISDNAGRRLPKGK